MNELGELARIFLKLGTFSFGGPAAHIAMMEKEIVQKRKWVSEQHFLDLIGATNLIPGPNSTELAIHIGRERAGWKGLFIAGLAFILPAVLITILFAVFYRKYGNLPQVQPYFYGIKPAIIAIILAAILPLAKRSLKSAELAIIGILALIFCFTGINEIYIMFGAGLFALALAATRNSKIPPVNSIVPLAFIKFGASGILSAANLSLFLTFLKIGSILYGSGYVLFAFLDTELVEKGILSRQQLIDAIAVGQFTPGPVFSSVTFIGYQINGISGAIVSTIGIFLPAFVFVALLNPLIMKMRNSKLFSSFLDAINIASVAIIIAICYQMGIETITGWRSVLILLISIVLAFGFRKINNIFIILFGSLCGYLFTFI